MIRSPVEMELFWLFVIFLVFSEAKYLKHWKTSPLYEDQRRIGVTLFLFKASSRIRCSVTCSQEEGCAIFSYDQTAGYCAGYKSVMNSHSSNAHITPSRVYFEVGDILYTVTVKTSTIKDASTDARVFLRMFGSFGSTDEIELVDNTAGKDKFDTGHTDVFSITSKDIGTLQRMKIGHDNSGRYAGWYLETVIISVNGQSAITFVVNSWITANTQLYMTIDAP